MAAARLRATGWSQPGLVGPVEFNVVLDALGTPNADDVKEQVAFRLSRSTVKVRKAGVGSEVTYRPKPANAH